MYKSILLAADGSENSFRAAKESLNFIDENTQVTILTVLNADEDDNNLLEASQSERVKNRKKEGLSKITDFYEEHGIPYEVNIERGIPKNTVVSAANSKEYGAVILGTRGLNNFQEMVLGSVSHKVAKRSKIPVIIVK